MPTGLPGLPDRRNFLWQLGVFSLGLLNGCQGKNDITFGVSCLGLNSGEKQEILAAFHQYKNKYGIIVPIILELDDFSREAQLLQNGQKIYTLEIAKCGIITIDPRASNKGDIVLHALTHANQNIGYDPETTDFTLEVVGSTKKPDRIYGYQGFSILIETPEGEKTAIRLIEEGVCEALVCEMKSTYIMKTYDYAALSWLVRQIIKRKNITPEALAHMIQNHELKKFIGILFDTNTPTQEQMVEVMEWFMAIKNGKDLNAIVERAFSKIKPVL